MEQSTPDNGVLRKEKDMELRFGQTAQSMKATGRMIRLMDEEYSITQMEIYMMEGVYTHANGATYNGHWVDDKQDGYGIETWPDGAKYEGFYKEGKKHGKGKLNFADGSVYNGEFNNNEISGRGEY